jgi:hypothetical protein
MIENHPPIGFLIQSLLTISPPIVSSAELNPRTRMNMQSRIAISSTNGLDIYRRSLNGGNMNLPNLEDG